MIVIQKGPRVNEEIRIREVRVIDQEGEQKGVLPTREAMDLARQLGMDLVEVAPNEKPPVCRIMDYGKHKYKLQKKEKEAKKKQKVFHVKEMRLSPKIDEHDYQVKLKHIIEFLERGDKVKAVVMFKGREITHRELGDQLVKKLIEDVKEVGEIEQRAKMEGRSIIMFLSPKGKGKAE